MRQRGVGEVDVGRRGVEVLRASDGRGGVEGGDRAGRRELGALTFESYDGEFTTDLEAISADGDGGDVAHL